LTSIAKADADEILTEIWRRSLGVDSLDLDSNLFDLSGDSITAIQVAEMATQHLAASLSMWDGAR
jgi:Phosphopantetheine attachment site